MAEFKEVMKQYKRMCKSYPDCVDCPFKAKLGWDCQPDALIEEKDFDIWETTVMNWAHNNPEPIYPTLREIFDRMINKMGGHWDGVLDKPITATLAKEFNIDPIKKENE